MSDLFDTTPRYRPGNSWDRIAAEKRLLGWCLERGRVPAVVRDMDPDALSPGLMRFLWGLLVELDARGVTWGPMDLVLWSMGERVGSEVADMLTFYRQELIVLPMAAGWDDDLASDVAFLEAEWMAAECRRLDAEERADNLEQLEMEVNAVRVRRLMGEPMPALWVVDRMRVHPGWLPYLREAA